MIEQKSIRKELTTNAGGAATFQYQNAAGLDVYLTGRFLGFHTTMGDMTNCTFTVKAVSADGTERILYTKAATANTNFTPVKVNCVDAAGAAIADVYDYQYLLNETITVTLVAGGNTKTMSFGLMFEHEKLMQNAR